MTNTEIKMKNTVSKTFVGIFLYLAFTVAAFSEEKPDYSKTDAFLKERHATDATSVDKPEVSFSSQRLYDKTDSFLELEEEEFVHDRRSARRNLKEIIANDLPNESEETKECIYALACGDIKTADLLKDKANLKARAINGDSAFLKHAHNENVSTFSKQIRWCYKNGINLDCMMQKRVVAGGEKVDEMYIEHISYNPAVAALIELVPELLNKRNPYNGQTAIFRASNTETLRIFLNAGAELDIIDNAGETVLIRSVLRSEYENAILLISYGADSKIPFEINDSPGDSRKTVYASLLDFLLNSSRSHNEDKDLLENRETLRSKRTQKPKEALIALLKRLE